MFRRTFLFFTFPISLWNVVKTWCLILQVVQGIRTHSSSRHLQLLKNVLILEREKQKSDRALEFHRKRSMIKDTAAKRIMRESLAGKSGEKPVRFIRRMCYGAASGLGSRQFLRGGNEHRRLRKQFPSTIVAFHRSSLLMFFIMSISKSMVILAIWSALRSVILFTNHTIFARNYICYKSRHSCSKLRHFCFISHHFCSMILHHFCFGYKIRVVQIWSETILVISDQTALHSVQLPV